MYYSPFPNCHRPTPASIHSAHLVYVMAIKWAHSYTMQMVCKALKDLETCSHCQEYKLFSQCSGQAGLGSQAVIHSKLHRLDSFLFPRCSLFHTFTKFQFNSSLKTIFVTPKQLFNQISEISDLVSTCACRLSVLFNLLTHHIFKQGSVYKLWLIKHTFVEKVAQKLARIRPVISNTWWSHQTHN